MLFLALSLHPADDVYRKAENELQFIEDGIHEVSDQVDEGYRAIENESELNASVLAWLHRRNSSQEKIYIQHVIPSSIGVPDSNVDPLVTVGAQVRWADQAYRYGTDSLFFL
jgi:hypothetical protein